MTSQPFLSTGTQRLTGSTGKGAAGGQQGWGSCSFGPGAQQTPSPSLWGSVLPTLSQHSLRSCWFICISKYAADTAVITWPIIYKDLGSCGGGPAAQSCQSRTHQHPTMGSGCIRAHSTSRAGPTAQCPAQQISYPHPMASCRMLQSPSLLLRAKPSSRANLDSPSALPFSRPTSQASSAMPSPP